MPAGRPKILTREEKKCSGCKGLKQIDKFSRNKSRGDGRSSYCKDCKNAYKMEYRKLHPPEPTHGHSVGGKKTSMYRRWQSMWERCNYPKHRTYKYYGGRGIVVCERWSKFENFLADMGEPPPGMSLDRIDNDGNYEPGNCRWATGKEQRLNQKIRGLTGMPITMSPL